jgi:hypothetical protein
MIKIIDNQLSEITLLGCIKEAEQAKSYTVLHGAGDQTYGFKYNWMFCGVEDQGTIKNNKLKILWEEVQKFLPNNIRLHRGYVNAHTYGVEDTVHEDDSDIKNGLTVIVYFCNDWYPEWFGQTMFFESLDKHHNEITKSVLPKFNRVLVFNKNTPHCVSPLSRRFTGVRLTCMFKVELLDEST